MDHADQSRVLADEEHRYGIVVEDPQRVRSQCFGTHRDRRRGHVLADIVAKVLAREAAPQVAIGEGADEAIVIVDHRRAAIALAAHLDRRIKQRGTGPHHRHIVIARHQLCDCRQLRAELAAGMKGQEVRPGEAAPLDERHCERVTQHRLHGGRRCWRQFVRACLANPGQREADVGRASGGAVRVRRRDDQLHAEAAAIGDDVAELGRLARPAQRHHDVLEADHAEIAMARLAGVQEQRGRAGRGHRRGNLAADQPAFSHAGHDQAARKRADRSHRLNEALAQRRRAQRLGKGLERVYLDSCCAESGEQAGLSAALEPHFADAPNCDSPGTSACLTIPSKPHRNKPRLVGRLKLLSR